MLVPLFLTIETKLIKRGRNGADPFLSETVIVPRGPGTSANTGPFGREDTVKIRGIVLFHLWMELFDSRMELKHLCQIFLLSIFRAQTKGNKSR